MNRAIKPIIIYCLAFFMLNSLGLAQPAPIVLERFLKDKDFELGFQFKYNGDTLSDFYYPTISNAVKHIYLWKNNEIIIQLDGTGKLLRYDSAFNFKRIDSTVYEGYSYGAFNFVYNDTIFSLGGYGFWKFNGMLRYFNDNSKSWGIISTNRVVPLRLWYNAQVIPDFDNKKLYVFYGKVTEEWQKDNPSSDENIYLQCFDLITKRWWDEDKVLNKEAIAGGDWASKPICYTEFGLLAFKFEELEVYDPKNNRIGVVKKTKARELQDNWYQNAQLIMLYLNHEVIFLEPRSKKISRFSFNKSDITWSNKQLYNPTRNIVNQVQKDSNTKYFIYGILIFILGCFSNQIFYRKRRVKNQNLTLLNSAFMTDEVHTFSEKPKSFRDTLTEVEKSLIDVLIKNSNQSKMTSVIQVNEVLGISRKDIKTQNNIRANAFQMINKKFSIYTGLHDELIQKQRTDFDKRFFEYFIHSKYLTKIK